MGMVVTRLSLVLDGGMSAEEATRRRHREEGSRGDTPRLSDSIIIMPHFFNTNTIRGCPLYIRGQEPGSSAAAPLDFESLISCCLQKCPGLGEAEAAALGMLESCAE